MDEQSVTCLERLRASGVPTLLHMFTNVLADQAREPVIAVVEDEEWIAHVIRRVLAKHGLTCVEVVRDPWPLVPRARAGEIDLVVMDMHMPGIDTMHAIRSLRAGAGNGAHLPILAISGDGSDENRSRAFAAGATEFIGKPFTRAELDDAVDRLLAERVASLAVALRQPPTAGEVPAS